MMDKPRLATSFAALVALLLLALPAAARKVKFADDPVKGEATAPLVLIEFGDFQ